VYIVLGSLVLFWKKTGLDRTNLRYQKEGYGMTILKEKTENLLEFVRLLYVVVSAAVFGLLGVVDWYPSSWWLPILLDVPPLLAGIYVVSNLEVRVSDLNPEKIPFVSFGRDTHEALTLLLTMFGFFWPFYAPIVLTVLLRIFEITDLPSMFVISVIPLALLGLVIMSSDSLAKR
jgi:hypothetical protein